MMTRSPRFTPSARIIAATLLTSSKSCRKVKLRVSPTSVEIQTSAFWSPRPARWRSTALKQRLVSPPTNQRANGGRE